MRNNKFVRKLSFCIICCFFLGFMGVVIASGDEEVTVMGTVVDAAYDDNEKLTAVSIETEEGPYLVINNAAGKQLLELVGKDIQATGIIGEDDEGKVTISVRTYKIVSE